MYSVTYNLHHLGIPGFSKMTDIASMVDTHYIVLLQQMRNAPGRLAAVARDLPNAAHTWQPEPETWSISHVVAHLTATHRPYIRRLERMLAEENPTVQSFGPDVARPDFKDDPDILIENFRASREEFLDFLSGIEPADWKRAAIHEKTGPTTIELQVKEIIKHDNVHIDQAEILLAHWGTIKHEQSSN